MTEELTTTEKREVMAAHESGEPIEAQQKRHGEHWEPCPKPVWNWERVNYRVAEKSKEPKRCWARYYERDPEDPWGVTWPVQASPSRMDDSEVIQLIELSPCVQIALAQAGISYEDSK